MSEQVSYSTSYESYTPSPITPTIWDRALDRARAEIVASGGLAASSNALTHLSSMPWLATDQREEALMKAMVSSRTNLISRGGVLSDVNHESILRLSTMLEAIASVPQLAVLAGMESGFVQIREEASALRYNAENGNLNSISDRARKAEEHLRDITGRAHRRLAMAEGDLLRETVGNTLQSLGYVISGKESSLRATRGTTCFWVDVNERGGLSLDVSGFSGRTCQTEIKAVENMLAQQGLVIKRTNCVEHQNMRGGDLAQKLCRALDGALPVKSNEVWGKPTVVSKTVHNSHQRQKLTVGG